jgi:hypothetical protein
VYRRVPSCLTVSNLFWVARACARSKDGIRGGAERLGKARQWRQEKIDVPFQSGPIPSEFRLLQELANRKG